MKFRYTIFTLLVFTLSVVKAQVGIGTLQPEEELHVAGSTSTIRVEGLDAINNPLNIGGSDLFNVVIDAEGTLGLAPRPVKQSFSDNISVPVGVQTTANAGLNIQDLYQQNFTLPARALVIITYYIPIEFVSYDGLFSLNDGRAKIASNFFYVGDGTIEDPSTQYGLSSRSYVNFTCDTAQGFVYNSQSVMITLEPGTYSVHMKGAVFGGDSGSDATFRGNFSTDDRLDISAVFL